MAALFRNVLAGYSLFAESATEPGSGCIYGLEERDLIADGPGEKEARWPARIGVVGSGWWALSLHLPALRDCKEVEVAALCDLNPSGCNSAGTCSASGGATATSTACWRRNGSTG
jgi:hypothetical protein